MTPSDLHEALCQHDSAIASLGLDIWIGMEPTFTQRHSESSEWLSEALGPEKIGYAYRILDEIRQSHPGGIVLHSLGRQYAGEKLPRWSIGYYEARNQAFAWDGPPDPQYISTVDKDDDIDAFWHALSTRLNQTEQDCPWQAIPFQVEKDALRLRILFRCDGKPARVDLTGDPSPARSSIHGYKTPVEGLLDDMAREGDLLLSLGRVKANNGVSSISLELPAIDDVTTFFQLLECISAAARECALQCLRLCGFPPPVNQSVAWTTLTPDPAVVEINMAPSPDAESFLNQSKRCYQSAEKVGLSSYRLQYNGVVSDSGGGGQFTIGGPCALDSPFLRYPVLLPRLIRYLNTHPALSYWFAPPSIGSSSQSPRPDEGLFESFQELKIALEQLAQTDHPQPEFIWRNLSPFMADPSGNQHRSELNIEKLWNPYLPGRGCLGLVEFRAFRMPRSYQAASAIAVLLRALVAMLIRDDKVTQLTDHGFALHDKYALPFYLKQDLEQVFRDLNENGLGLGESLEKILLEEPARLIARQCIEGIEFEVEQALEFWPLVGDVASQEGDGSRLMDSSTSRLQIAIRSTHDDFEPLLDQLKVYIEDYRLPMRRERDQRGPVLIFGLRYRSFTPLVGLHPGIAPLDKIHFVLTRPEMPDLKLCYHGWHPEGLAYPGLPEDMADAEQRRYERFVREQGSSANDKADELPAASLTEFCVDLRRIFQLASSSDV